jgi:hypothetical protein
MAILELVALSYVIYLRRLVLLSLRLGPPISALPEILPASI